LVENKKKRKRSSVGAKYYEEGNIPIVRESNNSQTVVIQLLIGEVKVQARRASGKYKGKSLKIEVRGRKSEVKRQK
jgi:hypothetical protein